MRLTSRSTVIGCALLLLAATAGAQSGAQAVPTTSATIDATTPPALCGAGARPLSTHGPSWSGWSPDGTNARFQSAAGLTAAQVPRLRLRWAFSLGAETEARSQPAVFGGWLFFGTASGEVYALDAHRGCIEWRTKVANGLRSGVAVGQTTAAAPVAVFFGAGPYAYALDAATGKTLWKTRVAQHRAAMITATPLLHAGSLYVSVSSFEELLAAMPGYSCCSFRGSVVALDAATGQPRWTTATIDTPAHATVKNKAGVQMYGPAGAAVWSTATFDAARNLIYIATGDNYSLPATATSDAVLAVDTKSGAIVWTRQLTAGDVFNDGCALAGNVTCPHPSGHDSDFGQPPILVSLPDGRRELVIAQKSAIAYALDPDHQGKLLWTAHLGAGGPLGGSEWGSASDGENLYVAISDLRLKSYAPLLMDAGHGGGLWALRLRDGTTLWHAAPIDDCGQRARCSPAQSQAVSAIPGVVFSGSDDGHLRAYATTTGKILWDVDTVRSYKTANGPVARGGSLDGPGPVIAAGMVYVNSGWGEWGGTPGDALLAFSVGGK